MLRVLLVLAGSGALAVWLGLIATGSRLLVAERLVRPGETYVVGGWGDVGAAAQPSLVCTYFTGRSGLRTAVFWYSAANVMGRDSCPFLYRPDAR